MDIKQIGDLRDLHRRAMPGPVKATGHTGYFGVEGVQVGPSIRCLGNKRVEKAMNSRMAELEQSLRDLLAQIELRTDCMDGRIERSALDDYMEAAERLVGAWPDFSRPGEIVNPVQAGVDRTTSGAIGQP